jgi:hypothetical protein
MACRVGQRDPGGAVGEPGGTERHRALCRLFVPVNQQIEVDRRGRWTALPAWLPYGRRVGGAAGSTRSGRPRGVA